MSDNFTKTQIQQLQKQFQKYDQNGDNSMTTKQLGQVMKSLGQHPTEYEIQMLIKQIDADGNGTIDFGEFLSLMGRQLLYQFKVQDVSIYNRKMKNIENQQELRDVFKYFDTDGDGQITPNDLKKALQQQNKGIDNETLNLMIDYMINQVDIDEDGKINFHQFVTIMMAL